MKFREFNEESSREAEIAELDMLASNKGFDKSKRREIEKHRRELIKAKQSEEKEKIKIAKEARKEQERAAKMAKKSIDAETATKLAEERQREALAKDRKRRARRRAVNNVFDFISRTITLILVIIGILCISNKAVRTRVAITFNNLAELGQHWVDGDEKSSNETVDDLLKPLGKELNEKGFDAEEE